MSQWSGHSRPGRGPQQTQHLGGRPAHWGLCSPQATATWLRVRVGGRGLGKRATARTLTLAGKSAMEQAETVHVSAWGDKAEGGQQGAPKASSGPLTYLALLPPFQTPWQTLLKTLFLRSP